MTDVNDQLKKVIFVWVLTIIFAIGVFLVTKDVVISIFGAIAHNIVMVIGWVSRNGGD